MLERERLESKKISKTNAVTSIMGHTLPEDDVYIGPSDYVPWLTDRKWAHIRVEGQAFGDVPLNVEMKLEVWDSPNSAGIVIDAVRCCKLALNHGVGGQLDGPSSYLMKSPHDPAPRRRGARGDREVHREAPRASPARSPSGPKRAEEGQGEERNRASVRGPPTPGSGASHYASPRGRELQHRPGDAVRVGGRPRGQPRRRAGGRRAGGPRPSRGHRRAHHALGAGPRDARGGARAVATACCPRPATGRGSSASATCCASARRAGARAAAGRRRPHDRGRPDGAAARPRPRPRAVGPERGQRGAAPLARAERRHVPRAAHRARSSRPRSRGSWWSSSSAGSTRAWPRSRRPPTCCASFYPADYRVVLPGADPPSAAGGRFDGDGVRIVFAHARSARRCDCSCARCGACPWNARGRPPCGRARTPRRPPPYAARCASAFASRGRSAARRTAARRLRRRGLRVVGRVARARPGACARSPPAPCRVAARLPVYEELLGEGELGLLFEPGDVETLAAQLDRLVSDEALRARLRGDADAAARSADVERASPTSWRTSTRAGRPAPPRGRQREGARAPGQAPADRRRPAHAHRPLARLRDAGRGAARHGAGAGAGRDRGDRPQRDLRRARTRATRPTGSR